MDQNKTSLHKQQRLNKREGISTSLSETENAISSKRAEEMAIELKISQEVTKQEYYKLEALIKRVELLKLIPSTLLSPELIKQLFDEQRTLLTFPKQVEAQHSQKVNIENSVQNTVHSPKVGNNLQTPKKGHSRNMGVSHVNEIINNSSDNGSSKLLDRSSSKITPLSSSYNNPFRYNETSPSKFFQTLPHVNEHLETILDDNVKAKSCTFEEPISPLGKRNHKFIERKNSGSPIYPPLSHRFDERIEFALTENAIYIKKDVPQLKATSSQLSIMERPSNPQCFSLPSKKPRSRSDNSGSCANVNNPFLIDYDST